MNKNDLGTRPYALVKVESLYGQIEYPIQPDHDADVHSSNFEQVDTCALQSVLNFHQVLTKNHHKLVCPSPSEQVMSTAKILDIDKCIDVYEQ